MVSAIIFSEAMVCHPLELVKQLVPGNPLDGHVEGEVWIRFCKSKNLLVNSKKTLWSAMD